MAAEKGITGREPDCHRTPGGSLFQGAGFDPIAGVDEPMWLVSAGDLAARDAAVRREVLAEAIERIESLAGDYVNGGHTLSWQGARHCVESLVGEAPTDMPGFWAPADTEGAES